MYHFNIGTLTDGKDFAEWHGVKVTSRNGASCKLARLLVANGKDDEPATLWNGGTRSMVIPSLHGWAGKTYSGGDSTPRLIKHAPYTG